MAYRYYAKKSGFPHAQNSWQPQQIIIPFRVQGCIVNVYKMLLFVIVTLFLSILLLTLMDQRPKSKNKIEIVLHN